MLYTYFDGSAWQVDVVDANGGAYVSLALDAVGLPHLSFYDSSGLRYARHDGATWHVETVDNVEPGYGAGVALALDDNGFPHIVYYDGTTGGAKHAFLCSPLDSLAVSGPNRVPAGVGATFSTTFAPPTATVPLVTWDNGAIGPQATYTWDQSGQYTLTAIASNGCGQARGALSVTVFCQPPASVDITGPAQLRRGQVAPYLAAVLPITSSPPLSITWSNGAVGLSAAYSWTVTGTYTVSATIANACGQAQGARQIVVAGSLPYEVALPFLARNYELAACRPVEGVTISGQLTLTAGTTGLFTASYVPITASLPVTVTWDNGTSGLVAGYSWPETGAYTITVTATNACGVVQTAVWKVQVLGALPGGLAGSMVRSNAISLRGPKAGGNRPTPHSFPTISPRCCAIIGAIEHWPSDR